MLGKRKAHFSLAVICYEVVRWKIIPISMLGAAGAAVKLNLMMIIENVSSTVILPADGNLQQVNNTIQQITAPE